MMRRRGFLRSTSLGLVGAWAGVVTAQEPARKAPKRAPATAAPPTADDKIGKGLKDLCAKHGIPGMIGAVVRGETVVAIGASGFRKRGSDERIRVGDLVHLGSDTKAMTATMIATLVEQGKLSWTSTVRDVFADQSNGLHPDFQRATLWELLTHRAGLPANGPWWELKGATNTEKRRDLMARMMGAAPESKPGTKFSYSNVGYAMAGLMAEQVTGRPWEELMKVRLFEPLGMSTAGFGAPGTPGKVDQPWGHEDNGTAKQFDNAPPLGPAGTVHCTVADWAKFIGLQLRGGQGSVHILKPATFQWLQTPPSGSDYAAGWIVTEREWAGGKALTHSGSNTMWYCTAWLAPARNMAYLSVANRGGDAAAKACDEAIQGLIQRGTASGRSRAGG